ncbi:hypothetical protein ACHQM5_027380 [Ranunculus cassubicifolius]
MVMDRMRECWIENCPGMEIVFEKELGLPDDRMPSLQILWLSKLSKLTTMCKMSREIRQENFKSLKHLCLEYCPRLVNLDISSSTLGGHFSSLETLEIRFCVRLKDAFAGQYFGVEDHQVFLLPRLHTLHLWELSSLQSIVPHGVYLPGLKKICVRGSPKLQRLPVHLCKVSSSGGAKKEIRGELEWWKNLNWEADETIVKDNVNFIGWKPPNVKTLRRS